MNHAIATASDGLVLTLAKPPTPSTPPSPRTLALYAANNLLDWVAEADRLLLKHDAARYHEEYARGQLRRHLAAAQEAGQGGTADSPIVVGCRAVWLDEDGELVWGDPPIAGGSPGEPIQEF